MTKKDKEPKVEVNWFKLIILLSSFVVGVIGAVLVALMIQSK